MTSAASTNQSTEQGASRATNVAPILYGAVALLYWISLFTYLPTLPTYAATMTGDLAVIGVILAAYGLAQALIRLPVGIVSDWIGRRKPFIVLGLALSAGGALLMGSARTPDALLFGRAVTGLAAGTWVPLTIAFCALYPPDKALRATTVLTLMSAIARVLATSTTSFLNATGGYSLAFIAAAVVAGAAILLLIPAREVRQPAQTPTIRGLWCLLTRRDVLLPAILNGLIHYVVLGVSLGFLPLLARDLGASDQTISLYTVLHLSAFTLTILLTAFLLKRFAVRPLVVASFIILAGGVACAALATSLVWLLVSQILTGVGFGIGYPVLMGMSIEHVAGPERASAMGLHQSVYAIGMFVGPGLSGILASSLGIPLMFGMTAAGTLILGVLGTAWATARRAPQDT